MCSIILDVMCMDCCNSKHSCSKSWLSWRSSTLARSAVSHLEHFLSTVAEEEEEEEEEMVLDSSR